MSASPRRRAFFMAGVYLREARAWWDKAHWHLDQAAEEEREGSATHGRWHRRSSGDAFLQVIGCLWTVQEFRDQARACLESDRRAA